MAKQNIYDNETFFKGYEQLRNREGNANDIFEKPALISLLPDLQGKTVIDIGCGFGEHCKMFVKNGAKKAVGIDISKKMLDVAKAKNSLPEITYINMPMENIAEISETFDIAVSSLAIHYIEDYGTLVRNIYNLLNKDGVFVFSQEHPLNTCFSGGDRWTKNENGEKLFANISGYGKDGERESEWFVDNVKKYHRKFSTIINTLIETGFTIEKSEEPVPTMEILEKYPQHSDLFHKPDFLLIRARKM